MRFCVPVQRMSQTLKGVNEGNLKSASCGNKEGCSSILPPCRPQARFKIWTQLRRGVIDSFQLYNSNAMSTLA